MLLWRWSDFPPLDPLGPSTPCASCAQQQSASLVLCRLFQGKHGASGDSYALLQIADKSKGMAIAFHVAKLS
jgi:hypothetical protein